MVPCSNNTYGKRRWKTKVKLGGGGGTRGRASVMLGTYIWSLYGIVIFKVIPWDRSYSLYCGGLDKDPGSKLSYKWYHGDRAMIEPRCVWTQHRGQDFNHLTALVHCACISCGVFRVYSHYKQESSPLSSKTWMPWLSFSMGVLSSLCSWLEVWVQWLSQLQSWRL